MQRVGKAAKATMAQTGSAQREPSMEEILASIRRIIEDSDAVRSPLDDERGDVEVAVSAPQPAEISHDEVEAFRTGLEEAETHPAEASQPAGILNEPAQPEQPAAVAQIHPIRSQPRPEETFDASSHETAGEPVEPASLESAHHGHFDEPPPPQGDVRPAIISDQTSRQVAAAFGELSEAFAASRKRSFDEMAEEMLRPMLQDWLDNNLPTLVEKLVREEIERVARGS